MKEYFMTLRYAWFVLIGLLSSSMCKASDEQKILGLQRQMTSLLLADPNMSDGGILSDVLHDCERMVRDNKELPVDKRIATFEPYIDRYVALLQSQGMMLLHHVRGMMNDPLKKELMIRDLQAYTLRTEARMAFDPHAEALKN